MSDLVRIREELDEFQDNQVNRLFTALFDDGQGDNARRKLVEYARKEGLHPSTITLLVGKNLLLRQKSLLDRQMTLLNEQDRQIAFLMEEVKKLNGGHAIDLPSGKSIARRNDFKALLDQKFGGRGAKARAKDTLGLTDADIRRFEQGEISDAMLNRMHDLPDWSGGEPDTLSRGDLKSIEEHTYPAEKLRQLIDNTEREPRPQERAAIVEMRDHYSLEVAEIASLLHLKQAQVGRIYEQARRPPPLPKEKQNEARKLREELGLTYKQIANRLGPDVTIGQIGWVFHPDNADNPVGRKNRKKGKLSHLENLVLEFVLAAGERGITYSEIAEQEPSLRGKDISARWSGLERMGKIFTRNERRRRPGTKGPGQTVWYHADLMTTEDKAQDDTYDLSETS